MSGVWQIVSRGTLLVLADPSLAERTLAGRSRGLPIAR